MPIDERFTVRPPEGERKLSGREILELADRLNEHPTEAAELASIRVVTAWGGGIKRLEVVVPELRALMVPVPAGDETKALPAAPGDLAEARWPGSWPDPGEPVEDERDAPVWAAGQEAR